MPREASFSKRYGYVRPKEILFRDELSDALRQPIINILEHSVSTPMMQETIDRVFNPFGIDSLPDRNTLMPSAEDEDLSFWAVKRVLLSCEWFRLYDLIEEVFAQLDFHDTELAHPDEEAQAYPLQLKLNDYFVHAGIGWQMVHGKMVARGNDAFERTVQVAAAELQTGNRPTAAERINAAIRNLSLRPKPDLSAAVERAINAMECVLQDVTGESKMTLGDYLKSHANLFPAGMKKALEGLWVFASNQGARHGKENLEPTREEAEFVVAVAAGFTTYLNRIRPRQ